MSERAACERECLLEYLQRMQRELAMELIKGKQMRTGDGFNKITYILPSKQKREILFEATRTCVGTGAPYKQCVCLCLKYKEMCWRILKRLDIVNLNRGISKLKLKIKVNLLQLLCIVVTVALNGEFERFGRFCVDFLITYSISQQSTQNLPNRSNSPFRATETTIHNN